MSNLPYRLPYKDDNDIVNPDEEEDLEDEINESEEPLAELSKLK